LGPFARLLRTGQASTGAAKDDLREPWTDSDGDQHPIAAVGGRYHAGFKEGQDMSSVNGGAPGVDGIITVDTPVGYELIGVKKKAAIQLMGSRLWGRFNPNHWDPVYAAEAGLKAPIQTGEMSTAYISEMCVNNFGRNFFRDARMECKYIDSTYANEVITTRGIVREKTPTGDAVRFKVEVWSENEEGEKKTAGWVEANVPA
jgi:hypothetical protein